MATAIGSHLTLYTGVPIDNSYEHTFTNTSLLSNFTHTRVPQNSEENAYYIRPDKNSVRVQHTHMSINGLNLYKCNYMTFINNNYEGKLFYCFITDVRYINDYTAEIDFEIDVMMTWLKHTNEDDGCTFEECFVEREHTDTDLIGSHTLEEPLDIGDFVYDNEFINPLNLIIVVGIRGSYINNDWVPAICRYLEGGLPVYDATTKYFFNTDGDGIDIGDLTNPFDTFIDLYASLVSKSKTDWLEYIYYAPNADTNIQISPKQGIGNLFNYTPRNNKLWCYPYYCLTISNYEGAEAIYPFEMFTGNDAYFNIKTSFTDSSATITPINYLKGSKNNMLIKNKYPVLSAISNEFSTYKGRLMASAPADLISNTLVPFSQGALVGSSGVIGGAVNAGANLISYVAQAFKGGELAKLAGGTPTNTNSGLMSAVNRTLQFGIYHRSIRTEYAMAIDDFFTKFGYKVNRLKVPTITISRLNYRYIKTIGCAINGYAPATAMSKIQEIMDNGITFWRTEDVGDYT